MMTLQTYFLGAWLMACVCAMYENREAAKNPIEVLLLTAIFSLCWPVVAVIVAGMMIRRMLVRGA